MNSATAEVQSPYKSWICNCSLPYLAPENIISRCLVMWVTVCGSYVIKAGDTFWKLAQERGTPVEIFMSANPGVVPERLQIGQQINLPCQDGAHTMGSVPFMHAHM